jgi:Ca-activated chloride channel family protein
MSSMDMGVTPGGVQDIGLARDIIESGGIPPAESFTAEGLFSEHDLPIDGPACEQELCPRVALAQIDTVAGDGPRLLAQLGFGTNIDPETFERDTLDLVVAVDVSGSMAGEKIGATRGALRALIDQLTPRDRLGIVAFDDKVKVRSELVHVDDAGRTRLLSAVDKLKSNGGTWIEGGLDRSYAMLVDAEPRPKAASRVMLFTDALPNVGNTRPGSFLGLARSHADRDIGLTTFGVGLDLGAELTRELSKVRGGNSYTLGTIPEVRAVFDEDFAFMVTPVAYDLEVDVYPSEDLTLDAAYGVPVDPADAVRFGASTLFLSRNAGGMGVTLLAPEGEPLTGKVEMALSYELATDGSIISDTTEASFAGGEAHTLVLEDTVVHAADALGPLKMAVLIDELAALTHGAAGCEEEGDLTDAAGIARASAERLSIVAAELDDADLLAEAELITQLALNIEGGPDNCAYGTY